MKSFTLNKKLTTLLKMHKQVWLEIPTQSTKPVLFLKFSPSGWVPLHLLPLYRQHLLSYHTASWEPYLGPRQIVKTLESLVQTSHIPKVLVWGPWSKRHTNSGSCRHGSNHHNDCFRPKIASLLTKLYRPFYLWYIFPVNQKWLGYLAYQSCLRDFYDALSANLSCWSSHETHYFYFG